MEQSNSNRFINILIIIAGVFCCIAAGFIPAPEGLLGNEQLSLVEAMPGGQLIPFFILPSVLMIAAGILVILGKLNALALVASIGGTILYAILDAELGFGHQAYAGVLMNMFGAIMMVAGTALQAFATDNGPAVVSRKAAKKRSNKNPKEFRYERRNAPKYDDIYVDAAGTAAVARALDLAELEAAGVIADPQGIELTNEVSQSNSAAGYGSGDVVDEIAALRAAIGLDNNSGAGSEVQEVVHSMSADELRNMIFADEAETDADTDLNSEDNLADLINASDTHATSTEEASAVSEAEEILLGKHFTSEDVLANKTASDADTAIQDGFNWVSPEPAQHPADGTAASEETVGTISIVADEADNLESIESTAGAPLDAAHKAMADALETPNQTMTDFYAGIEEIFLDYEGRR